MSEHDFRCYPCDELDFDKLDPGVRNLVRWLIEEGFEPTDSGDGKFKIEQGWDAEEVVPFPHVYIHVDPEAMIETVEDLRLALWTNHGIMLEGSFNEEMKPYIEVLWYPGGQFAELGTAVVGLFNVSDDKLSPSWKPLR